MSAFLVKLDEDLSQTHVDFLNRTGYSAERVTDEGLSGAADAIVWRRAHSEGRFFITLDLDFADVRQFPPGTHPEYCSCGRGIAVAMPFKRFYSAWSGNIL
jgi:predicted nuclease of predicted toxin-antitoxin system